MRVSVGFAPGTAGAYAPAIAASGSSVYVAWEDDRNLASDIFFNRSVNGGASWLAADRRLNLGSAPGWDSAYTPQLAALGPMVHAVWADDRFGTTNVFFNRSLNAGTTWLPTSTRIDVGSAPGLTSAWQPRIAISGGLVFVAWLDDRLGFQDVFFNRSLDLGSTWLASPVRVNVGTPGMAYADELALAADGASIYVVWSDTRSGSTDVYFNRSLDAGTTWLPADVLLDLGMPAGAAAIAPVIAAAGLSVYVAWEDYRNGPNPDIYFNRSLDGGSTWLAQNPRLDTGSAPGAASSGLPQIANVGSAVFVIWEDNRHSPFNSDIYFNRSLDDGATWLAADVRINTGTAPGAVFTMAPQIAAAGSAVSVVWEDDRNNNTPDIYENRSLDAGTTWLATAVRLDLGSAPGAASSYAPRVAVSGASIYAVWEDDRHGFGSDIYFDLAAGYQPHGTGTAGAGALVPVLTGAGNAAIGGTVALEATSGRGGAPGLLSIGAGPASKVSLPLLGGTLLVSPASTAFFVLGGTAGTPGVGSLVIPVPVPNVANLLGLNVNFQGLFVDAAAVQGVSMSNAVETWIG